MHLKESFRCKLRWSLSLKKSVWPSFTDKWSRKGNSSPPRGVHRAPVPFGLRSDHSKEKALAQISDLQTSKVFVIRPKSVNGLFSICLNGTNLRRKQCVAARIMPAGFLHFLCFLAPRGTMICMGDESRFLMLPPCVSMDPVKCRLGLARRMGGTLLKQNWMILVWINT